MIKTDAKNACISMPLKCMYLVILSCKISYFESLRQYTEISFYTPSISSSFVLLSLYLSLSLSPLSRPSLPGDRDSVGSIHFLLSSPLLYFSTHPSTLPTFAWIFSSLSILLFPLPLVFLVSLLLLQQRGESHTKVQL